MSVWLSEELRSTFIISCISPITAPFSDLFASIASARLNRSVVSFRAINLELKAWFMPVLWKNSAILRRAAWKQEFHQNNVIVIVVFGTLSLSKACTRSRWGSQVTCQKISKQMKEVKTLFLFYQLQAVAFLIILSTIKGNMIILDPFTHHQKPKLES